MLFRYYKSVDGSVRRLVLEGRLSRLIRWHPDFPPGIQVLWKDENGESVHVPENVWACLKIKFKDSDCFLGWTSQELLKDLS